MKNKFRVTNSEQWNGLIDLLSHLPDNLTIIEIGSAYGESAECFLSTGKVDKIYCIDPWRDDREQYFDKRHENDKRVIKMKMTGDEAVDSFEDNSVDFCYIDAVHTYGALKKDILNYLPKIKKGGWIGGHDYNDTFKGVIQAVDERFGKPDYLFKDSSWLVKL